MIARPTLLPQAAEITRHSHATPYATIVLSGGYEEAGDAGRFRVEAGDVLVHGDFSAHRDVTAALQTAVLDLPLPIGCVGWPARGRVVNPDAIIRLAGRDLTAAVALLHESIIPVKAREDDLPDRLGAALLDDVRIAEWAAAHGRARETLSRQFNRLYGVDAARFRAEARARRAWKLILTSNEPLAAVAQASGHADQAHMTRAVHALTGMTPAAWRRQSHRFKTGQARDG